MSDVFISYSHRDTDEVRKLTEEIRRQGVDVFLDSDQTHSGDRWRETLEYALRAAQVIVVVLGAERGSPWMEYELSAALRRTWTDPSTRLIPIFLGDATPPAALTDLQGLRLRSDLDLETAAGAVAAAALHRSDGPAGYHNWPIRWREPIRRTRSLTYSTDGRLVAVTGRGIQVRDPVTGSVTSSTEATGNEAVAQALLPGGVLATGTSDGTITLRNLGTGGGAGSRGQVFEEVRAVAFARNGTVMAIASGDTVSLWDPAHGGLFERVHERSGPIRALSMSPDGDLFAVACGDRVDIWDTVTGARLRSIHEEQGPVPSIAFSPDGEHLAVAVGGTVQFRRRSGERVADPLSVSSLISDVAYSPDGRLIAVAGETGELTVTELSGSGGTSALPPHTGAVHIAFDPDSTGLATADRSSITLWEIPSATYRRRLAAIGAAAEQMDDTSGVPGGGAL